MAFPGIVEEPGSYSATFEFRGKKLPGTLELSALRAPVALFFDGSGQLASGGFPQYSEQERLVGRLSSNLDVVMADVHVAEYFPGQYRASAAYAVVGLEMTEQRFDGGFVKAELQMEGLDEFFGTMPIQEYMLPGGGRQDFTARREQTRLEWRDEGIKIGSEYGWTLNSLDGYEFRLSFIPTFDLESQEPLPAKVIIYEWLKPLVRLLTFSTKHTRRLSWATLVARDDAGSSGVRAQVFGSGMTQEPFYASRPEYRNSGDKPLFTRHDLPVPLPKLLGHWLRLDGSDNPFPELYRLASAPDLPARARFLYLVQALEALHGFENRQRDQERLTKHRTLRHQVIDDVRKVSQDLARIVKDLVSNRPPESLERRLNGLLDATPAPVVERLANNQSDPMALRYLADGDVTFSQIARRIRNDLSHGNFNPEAADLKPWIERLNRLAQAQLLRLLGFDAGLISSRLG